MYLGQFIDCSILLIQTDYLNLNPLKGIGMNFRSTHLKKDWFVVIAAGAIMGTTLGIRHIQGLFMLPVVFTNDWSRDVFGLALAIQNLVWGLIQPLTGMLADRFGSAKIIFIGLATYAIGLFLMTQLVNPFEFSWVYGLLIGVALSASTFGTVYGALSRIFDDQTRQWALATSGAISGLGIFCMVPLTQQLISNIDWQGAAVAIGMLIIALTPLSLLLRHKPIYKFESSSLDTNISFRSAISDAFSNRGFLLLNIGFLACGFQLAFIATYLPAYLVDGGLSLSQASATLAIIALSNIAGTYVLARLSDWITAKHMLCCIYALRTLATTVFLLIPITPWSAYAFAAVMGFLWLGTVPLTNEVVIKIFGTRYIATLFGFVFLGHQIGGFLGLWLGGVAYNTYHSYNSLWIGSIVLGLIATLLHWMIDDKPQVRMNLKLQPI